MQFSAGQDVTLKNYRSRSSFYRWTLIMGSQRDQHFFQYSSITHEPLGSCRLGELKYAISPGQDVRLKNKSVRKCKKWHCETSVHVHGHCIVRRSRQVWTSQNRCEVLFFFNSEYHALQIWPTPQTCVQFPNRSSLETLQPYEVVESGLRHASVGVRCELG